MYTQQHIEQLNKDIEKFDMIHPITPDMKLHRSGVNRMVMLDRYSQKDTALKTLKSGDLVVLTVKEDPKFPGRGFGYVRSLDKKNKEAVIELESEYVEEGKESTIIRPINKIEKPLELYYEQIALRNARELSEDEVEQEVWFKKFTNLIAMEKLVPAGRVLYGAGSGTDVTYFNCYVLPMVKDSRGGINNHRKKAMEIMSRGGGVGTNGSTLRPRNTLARGVNGKSSGSVSWLDDIAKLTHLVSQGGSRRGAQMILLSDWHPDVIEFILSKMQNPDILRYIMKEIDNPFIQEMAKEKLSFTPLTDSEKEIYELTIRHNVSDESRNTAEKSLKDGGTYSVNDPEFLSGANISIALTKEFMAAVENDEMYSLRFPDVENYTKREMKFYNENWHNVGDVREWEKMGYAVKVYREVRAKDVWNLINICATYAAEPGVFFIDNANDKTNAAAYGQKVVATNPCGEQPLAPYSVCNLAAINLSVFANFGDKTFDKEGLIKTVAESVRLQDNVIDKSPYFLKENEVQALGERRIGLGVMGLSDLLIKLAARYGSEDGLTLTNEVFETIATAAYRESIELAKEKGSFSFLIGETEEKTMELRHKFINTGFMKEMPEDIRMDVLEFGIRNSHLLTVAPTGSTGTMIGCSTGLEPYYSFSYYRSGRLGANIKVDAKIVEDYLKYNPEHEGELPDYFVSAMELSPEEHVNTQCAIQRWIDSSLSKTVNAPKGYTVEQVQKVYEMLHKGGAKGGTVYVDGSRSMQVLSLIEDDIAEIAETAETVVYGTQVGNTCPMCREGKVIDSGGCSTCSNCGSQLKCDI
ncbi:vitamin B12-dependent ribonucleotide reductase [Psychrobacillus sp. FSL K6-1464]|uniref:vitamin B12-dependent ribonucleotide reductase n=1 Tax=Psychrobacillus sp. FSL K6-1464 TaxID=2921545 RepID=UPI0030FD112F